MDQEEIKKENQNKNEGTQRSFVFWIALFFALLALDQATKYLAFRSTFADALNRLKPLVQNFEIRNYNFAFSIHMPAAVMYIIYFVILAGVVWYVSKNFYTFSSAELFGWLLVAAGATANVFERIALGYVRDFILVANGIFNLADIYILLGIVVLLLSGLGKRKMN